MTSGIRKAPPRRCAADGYNACEASVVRARSGGSACRKAGQQPRRRLKPYRYRKEREPGDVRRETRGDEEDATEDEHRAFDEVRRPEKVAAHAGDEGRDPDGG